MFSLKNVKILNSNNSSSSPSLSSSSPNSSFESKESQLFSKSIIKLPPKKLTSSEKYDTNDHRLQVEYLEISDIVDDDDHCRDIDENEKNANSFFSNASLLSWKHNQNNQTIMDSKRIINKLIADSHTIDHDTAIVN